VNARGLVNLILHTVVLRDKDPPRGDEFDAIYEQLIGKLSVELANDAELLCFSCGTRFGSVAEFGAAFIRPHSDEGGDFGAACKACAEAATNDELVSTFEAEGRPRC
jgi:hypothetical protein